MTERELINKVEALKKLAAEPEFDKWWAGQGVFIDPDTEDVSWFDKRKELAGIAFIAGFALANDALPIIDAQAEEIRLTAERANREAQLACDLRSSQDEVIERCAKAVEDLSPEAAMRLREHCGSVSDDEYAVSGEDFGELRRENARQAERIAELGALLKDAAAQFDRLTAEQEDCGIPGTECALQNCGKDYWLDGIKGKLADFRAKEGA